MIFRSVRVCRLLNLSRCYSTKRNMNPSVEYRKDPVVMKMNNELFNSIFTDELRRLHEIFMKHDYEIRIAGGAVRDLLLDKKPTDLDFATTATPTQMKQMFQEENIRLINMNGEKHGTITPRINDKENFEVTTLRIDVVTDGRHAEVEFTKDWLLDANRRDLTINAMFLGLDGNVYDYFYGFEDLQKRIVRFVGDADERIKEDYLRILRYFRFYGKIATDPDVHDPEILQTITLNANGLSRISGERIWVELKKILQGNFASELCTKIIECELSQHIGLPEKPSLEKLHSLWSSRRNDKPYHYCTLFSSLLETPEDALRLHERLKFSAYERDLIYFILNQNEKTADVEDLRNYQQMCLQSSGQPKILKQYVIELLKFQGKWNFVEELENWQFPKFPINGNILKNHNCPTGKVMGVIMDKLKEEWVKNNFESTEKELLEHLPRILEEIKNYKNSQIKRPKFE